MTAPLPFQLNSRVNAVIPYKPGKPSAELERELGIKDTIKLASNENPLGASPQAIAAMIDMASSTNRYPDGGAYYLKKKLSAKLGFPPECFIIGNGSTEIVEMLAKACLPPEGESLVSEGAFIMYRLASLAASAAVRSVPMATGWKHDLQAMARQIGPSTRLVFIANPNNPTGTWMTGDELDQYFSDVPDSVLTVVDEAYREYIDEPAYPDATESLRRGARVVVLRTFSKVHGLAGARVGYAIADPSVVSALEKVRSPFNTNSLGQVGAMAALDDTDHMRHSREENRLQRQRLETAFREMGLDFIPSVANFLLTNLGLPGREAYGALLEQGIIVRPVKAYGFPDHLRISVGTATENLRLLEAIREVRLKAGLQPA